MDQLLINFLLLFLKRRAFALIHIACTSLDSTIGANVMLIAFGGTAVVFHADFAVENHVTVPVMVVTEILLYWALV